MSVYTEWVNAKNEIKNNYEFDYPKAIDYYAQLKNNMLRQLQFDKDLKAMSNNSLSNMIEQDLEELTSITTSQLMELSNETLQTIVDLIEEKFKAGDVKNYLNSLDNEINQQQKDIKSQIINNSNKIRKMQDFILSSFNSQDYIMTLVNNALNSYAPPGGSTEIIQNFLKTFLLNTIKWKTELGYKKIFINKNARTTLAGYYKEIIEKKLLTDFFSKHGIKNINVDLVAGKNTINDLLISFIEDFNGTSSISQDISFIDENMFGVQIKARDLQKMSTGFMKISHQLELKNAFQAEMEASGINNYSWACGVAFLGQLNNITQALGKNNVVFISGPHRYFMDSFIQTFRKQKMYLAFEMNDEHKITNQVGLQRFIHARQEILLKRFQNI